MKDFNGIESSILVKNRPIKEYYDDNANYWLEAREGSPYSIRIKNNTWGRKLIIVSVDGINVITGQPAEKLPKDGYVVNGNSPLIIEGWRTSDSTVKEFIFTFNKNKSYAVKLGQGKENLGVIGILAYDEYYISYTTTTIPLKSSNPYYTEPYYTVTCANTGNISNPTCYYNSIENIKNIDFQAGTAKGKEVNSPISEVYFTPGSLFSEHIYYYDSYDNLKKRGIIPEQKHELPKPFTQSKYCPDL